jgi:SulP family sulfate permease
MVSLITVSVLAPLATAGAADYVNLALFLALLVGLLQVVMGIAPVTARATTDMGA